MPTVSRSLQSRNFCSNNSKKSLKYSQGHDTVCQMALLGSNGGSRGGGPGPSLFWVKKEMTEWRKASRASKSTPLLSSRSVSTTDYYKLPQARQSYAHVFHVFNKSCFTVLSSLNYGTCWFYLSLIWKFELNTSLSSIKLRIIVFLQLTLNSFLKRFCSDQLQSTSIEVTFSFCCSSW